jgi:hypothetical protein
MPVVSDMLVSEERLMKNILPILAFIASSALVPAQTQKVKTPVPSKDITGTEALNRVSDQMKLMNAESAARNDALDLANAKLEDDIARLEGKLRQTRKVAAARGKVDADARRGLHPDHDAFAYLVADVSDSVGDGGVYAKILKIDTEEGNALQKIGVNEDDPSRKAGHK